MIESAQSGYFVLICKFLVILVQDWANALRFRYSDVVTPYVHAAMEVEISS